jgi:NAD+ synthase (glutamine-hydrolysing)
MVDLQPIADIHKSEVYKLANLLGISESIINRTPVGDVFDGSTDYDLIGARYDNVEYFQLLDDYNIPRVEGINSVSHVMDKLAIQDEFTAIMNIHKKNAHKYKVGLPSRFIDVMLRKTNKNGGW